MNTVESFVEKIKLDALIYYPLPEFARRVGLTENAIRKKIDSGKWSEGREYMRDPDKRIHINIINYQKWIESQWQAKREQEEAFSKIPEAESSASRFTGSTRTARISRIDGDSELRNRRVKKIARISEKS